MSDFAIVPIEARRCIGQRRRVKPQDLGRALGEILSETSAFIAAQGLVVTSPPMMLYLDHDQDGGTFLVQGGFFVAEAEPPEAPFRLTTVPGGEAARAIHVGPYAGLGGTHWALKAWIEAQGRTPAAHGWEVYVDDPGEVPEGRLRTEVWCGLKPQGGTP